MARSRGQVVLVAAFALAITFVALALVLNTAIFAESLATRGTVDAHDTEDLRDAALEAGSDILWETNRDETDPDRQVATYRDRIADYEDVQRSHAATAGTLQSITVASTHNGTRIYQNESGPFESPEGNDSWEIAGDVSDARAFTLQISDADPDTPFVLNATNGGAEWEMAITANGSGYDVTVTDPNGTETVRSFGDSPLELSVTNGSAEGEAWPALRVQEHMADAWTLEIGNGSAANGTYTMVVDETAAIGWAANGQPTHTPAIYNATLDLELTREDLTYEVTVSVEPERRRPP
jgi:hypothetical protein